MWWLWRENNTEKCSGAGKRKTIEMWWQLYLEGNYQI